MLSVSLGIFAISFDEILLVTALLVAAAVGLFVGRRGRIGIGNILLDMLIAGALCARVAFVATWFDSYRAAPWSMLDIRDGGFSSWAGLVAALVVALWQAWRRAQVRRPLIAGLAAGAMVWGAMYAALRLLERPALPAVTLQTLAGATTNLAALAAGKPMVVNMWATWCPPCRREMPVLAAAQKREPDVRFVFADQGEDAATVRRYLAANGLDLVNVVLDLGGELGPAVGSRGLPTTLFYDADGRLVDTQLGALSVATLADKLRRLPAKPSARK